MTCFLFLVASFLLLVACDSGEQSASTGSNDPAQQTTGESALFTAGIFSGEADGWGSEPIVLDVEFSENEIIGIEVVSHSETPGISDGAFEQVPSQIIEHQTLMVDAVTGATMTTGGIIDAVKEAVIAADGDVDALMLETIDREAQDPIHLDVDVVVIGAGGAGMSAGISSLEHGADVLVLEKTSAVGGNTLAAGQGYLAWNAVQPERIELMDAVPGQTAALEAFLDMDPDTFADGFDKELITLQEQIREFLASEDTDRQFDSIELHMVQTYLGSIRYELDETRVYSNYDHTTLMVRNSLEAIEWIEEMGGRFKDELGEPIGAMWRRGARPYTNNQVDLFDPMLERISELGGEIMFNTKAEELLVENGVVIGVQATQVDGTPVTVHASSVIIATGGFAANREMVADFNNYWENFNTDIGTTNVSGALGEGIVMAQKIGADVTQMGITQLMPIGFAYNGVLATGHGRGSLYIDPASGRRFVDETAERDVIAEAAFSVGGTFFEIRRQEDQVHNQLNFADDGTGRVYADDTLEGLAEQVGIDPDVLVEEVAKFNEFAENGYDEDFGRVLFDNDMTGPYMIRVLAPSTHYTNGGLLTTIDARVVGTDGEIIPNLFAAGEVMGGIHGGNRLGGNAVPEAFVFGRIAGEIAALNAE